MANETDATILGKLMLVAARRARENGYADGGFRVVVNAGSGRRPDRLPRAPARAGRPPPDLAPGLIYSVWGLSSGEGRRTSTRVFLRSSER